MTLRVGVGILFFFSFLFLYFFPFLFLFSLSSVGWSHNTHFSNERVWLDSTPSVEWVYLVDFSPSKPALSVCSLIWVYILIWVCLLRCLLDLSVRDSFTHLDFFFSLIHSVFFFFLDTLSFYLWYVEYFSLFLKLRFFRSRFFLDFFSKTFPFYSFPSWFLLTFFFLISETFLSWFLLFLLSSWFNSILEDGICFSVSRKMMRERIDKM